MKRNRLNARGLRNVKGMVTIITLGALTILTGLLTSEDLGIVVTDITTKCWVLGAISVVGLVLMNKLEA